MSVIEDNERRRAALLRHPLSQNTMNSEGLGGFGMRMDLMVEAGWLGIVERMFDSLSALPEHDSLAVSQIKEKFGGLRVHLFGGSDEAEPVVARAEAEAHRTCQFCGARGRIRSVKGWYANVCATHADLSLMPGRETTPLQWADRGEDAPAIRIPVSIARLTDGFVKLEAPGATDCTFGPGLVRREAEWLNAYFEGGDVATAPDPEAAMRDLDEILFGPAGIARTFSVERE